MADAEPEVEHVTTRDGQSLLVRPIARSDRNAFLRGFAHLSEEARYKRFLSPIKRLTESEIEYFTAVDHQDHEALIALTPDGEIVAVARFIRLRDQPNKAEVAVTVWDEWQGRGVGTAMLSLLASRARRRGIEAFVGVCLAGNTDMRQLLEELGPGARTRTAEPGVVEVEAQLPSEHDRDRDLASAALRAAARGYEDASS